MVSEKPGGFWIYLLWSEDARRRKREGTRGQGEGRVSSQSPSSKWTVWVAIPGGGGSLTSKLAPLTTASVAKTPVYTAGVDSL